MKLALGTVQFGLEYGIANKDGRVTLSEAQSILAHAWAGGVSMLDTAIGYGDSEQRLGEIGVQQWEIVSKLLPVPEGCNDASRWVAEETVGSLQRLKVKGLYGLLLHRPGQLLEKGGEELYRAMQGLRQDGLARKIGVSIYDPSELDALCDRYQFDLVQAPFNLLDRRLIDSGWMKRLQEIGTELHVRSAFLQGLLLMNSGDRPKKFDRWVGLWTAYDAWLGENKLTPTQACLGYALSFSGIGKVVVGVDSVKQLEDILRAAAGKIPDVPEELRCSDIDLINPARWAGLQTGV